MRTKKIDVVRESLESTFSVQNALIFIFFEAVWILRYIYRRLRSSVRSCYLKLFKKTHRACLRINQSECSLRTIKDERTSSAWRCTRTIFLVENIWKQCWHNEWDWRYCDISSLRNVHLMRKNVCTKWSWWAFSTKLDTSNVANHSALTSGLEISLSIRTIIWIHLNDSFETFYIRWSSTNRKNDETFERSERVFTNTLNTWNLISNIRANIKLKQQSQLLHRAWMYVIHVFSLRLLSSLLSFDSSWFEVRVDQSIYHSI